MATVKASWSALASGAPLSCAATNLPGDLLATASQAATGPCVQIWQQAVSAGDWDIRSQVQVPEPVVALDWAHPESGLLLAAASRTGQVYVLEAPRPRLTSGKDGLGRGGLGQQQGGGGGGQEEEEDEDEDEPLDEQEWRLAGTLTVPSTSGIAHLGFAPRQYGLLLCALCADGLVVMWEADRPLAPNSWCLQAKFQVGGGSASGTTSLGPSSTSSSRAAACTGLSWRSFTPGLAPLLAVATRQGVEVWQYVSAHMAWQRAAVLEPSSPPAASGGGGCTSVHWAPPVGRPVDLVAASHGRVVDVWSLAGDTAALAVERVASLEHSSQVHQVEFNRLGTCLGVATNSNHVHVWKTNLVGTWQLVSVVEGSAEVAAGGDEGAGAQPGMVLGLD